MAKPRAPPTRKEQRKQKRLDKKAQKGDWFSRPKSGRTSQAAQGIRASQRALKGFGNEWGAGAEGGASGNGARSGRESKSPFNSSTAWKPSTASKPPARSAQSGKGNKTQKHNKDRGKTNQRERDREERVDRKGKGLPENVGAGRRNGVARDGAGDTLSLRKEDIAELTGGLDPSVRPIDRGSAEDDARMIRYLEKQLGIKGKDDEAKIKTSIAQQEFGGDDGLLDLTWGILNDDQQFLDAAEKQEEEYRKAMASGEVPAPLTDDQLCKMFGQASGVNGDGEDDAEGSREGSEEESGEESGEGSESDEASSTESGGENASEQEMGEGIAEEESLDEASSADGLEERDDDDSSMFESGDEGSDDDGDESGDESVDNNSKARTGRNENGAAKQTCQNVPQTYIPPHVRKKMEAEAGGLANGQNRINKLKGEALLRFRALFNRISEANLNVLFRSAGEDAQKLLAGVETSTAEDREKSLRVVADAAAEAAVQLLRLKSGQGLLAAQTAMVGALSTKLTQFFLWSYFTKILAMWSNHAEELSARRDVGRDRASASAPDTDSESEEEDVIGDEALHGCRHAIGAISLLFVYDLISVQLLLAFANLIGARAPRMRTLDFLSLLLRHTGTKMQKVDQASYKRLCTIIQKEVDAATLAGTSGLYLDFVKHELAQTGKEKSSPASDKVTAMRQWLHNRNGEFKGVNWGQTQLDSAEPECDVEVMMTNCLPASVAAASSGSGLDAALFAVPNEDGRGAQSTSASSSNAKEASKEAELLAAARLLGFKSPLQQRILVAMFTASSVQDASDVLIKIASKKSQSEHVVAVLLMCAVEEKTPNPFYPDLALELCTSEDRKVAFRFQRAFREGMHRLALQLSEKKDAAQKKNILSQISHTLLQEGGLKGVSDVVANLR